MGLQETRPKAKVWRSGADVFRRRGAKLVAIWTRPTSGRFPAVLFLHGFPGSEKNVDLQRRLMKRGIASLALHFRGAWGSEGLYRFSTLLDDARAGLRFLASRPGVDRRRLAVFGFSMGGWTAIHLAASEPGLKACAAVAPVGGPEMLRGGATSERILRNSRALRVGSVAALARDFERTVRRLDPAASAARSRVPLLLVHGTADDLVPHAVSERIRAATGGRARLILERGAAHDFLDRREKLVRIVGAWLARRLS